MTPRLTALQRDLLEALSLTGGAVLAGSDFGHRTADDRARQFALASVRR